MTADQQSLISELESIPTRMAEAARLAAQIPQPEGEWSPRTILIHMLAGDVQIWQVRLKMLAEQDKPHWQWTEPDLAEWKRRFESRSLDVLAAEFTRTRGEIVSHLKALDDAGWARVGTHATYGLLDVAGLCAKLLEHDYEHLAELQKRNLK